MVYICFFFKYFMISSECDIEVGIKTSHSPILLNQPQLPPMRLVQQKCLTRLPCLKVMTKKRAKDGSQDGCLQGIGPPYIDSYNMPYIFIHMPYIFIDTCTVYEYVQGLP